MPLPSFTYTFVAGTTIDSAQVNTNNNNMISNMTDGTRDFTIGTITTTGAASFGSDVTLGATTADDVIFNTLTATTVPYIDASKIIKSSAVTPTELGLLSGFKMFLPRPSFKSVIADSSQVVIPASAAKPAVVRIGTAFYTNTSDLTLDLDTAGANGLDTGTKAAETVYYVYAILPVSGTTFRGVMSAVGPDTGPSGFSTNWSYLGSFRTKAASAVPDFQYCDGMYMGAHTTAIDFVADSAAGASETVNCSVIAKAVYLRGLWSVIDAVGNSLTAGATSSNTFSVMNANSTTAANNTACTFWLPMVTAQTLYMQVEGATTVVNLKVLGWKEQPEDYQ